MIWSKEASVAILDQAISCSNVRVIFLLHELFWFCLVQVSTTYFCCFPPAFMANARSFDDAEPVNAQFAITRLFFKLWFS